jgi:GxxExxY protein
LVEPIYEVCFCHSPREIVGGILKDVDSIISRGELTKRGFHWQRQVDIPIVYDGITFDEGLRLDVLVEDKVICELKSVEEMKPLFTAQLLAQLKLTGKRLGFLINFNVPVIKSGIKRLVL